MRSYYVSPEVSSTRGRVLSALLLAAFSVALLVLIDRIILRRQLDLIDVAAFAVFFTAWTLWSGPEPGFELEVDDSEIRVVRDGSVESRISRDQALYVREWGGNILRRPMLVISAHGPIAMRFLGFVAVPKSLPEYEQIKTQALTWLENSSK
jgi:hypothetical protein